MSYICKQNPFTKSTENVSNPCAVNKSRLQRFVLSHSPSLTSLTVKKTLKKKLKCIHMETFLYKTIVLPKYFHTKSS